MLSFYCRHSTELGGAAAAVKRMWRAAFMQLMKTSTVVPPAAASMLPRAPPLTSRHLGAATARLTAPTLRSLWTQLPRSFSAMAAPSSMLAQETGNMQAQAYNPQGGVNCISVFVMRKTSRTPRCLDGKRISPAVFGHHAPSAVDIRCKNGASWTAGGPVEPAVIHEVEWSVNSNNYISLIGTLGQVCGGEELLFCHHSFK